MIIPLPSTPVTFAEGVSYEFPADACCNCGTTGGLRLLSQDTRLTRYWLSGGSEVTLQLPLPFCERCEKSSRRRSPTWIQYFLVGLLGCGAAMGILFVAALLSENFWLTEHVPLLSLGLGVVGVAAFYGLRRPGTGQSSYYQPVRITALKRAFRSGTVRKITFYMANGQYAQSFRALNHDAVSRGQVEVKMP